MSYTGARLSYAQFFRGLSTSSSLGGQGFSPDVKSPECGALAPEVQPLLRQPTGDDFMDLGELQVFLMVAKEGSFSRAAERLYRTQPAISLAVRKLEDSLGQPLFVRGARPVRLTDAGALLKDYAERLLNLRDEVRKGLAELEGLKRGELALGVNESSIHALLPTLSKFREMHPGIQVRVHRMFSRDIPHEVLNYRLDLGAVSYVPRDPQ